MEEYNHQLIEIEIEEKKSIKCHVKICQTMIYKGDTYYLLAGYVITCLSCASSPSRGWTTLHSDHKYITNNIIKKM